MTKWLELTPQERLLHASEWVAHFPEATVTLSGGVPHVHLHERVFVVVPGGEVRLGQDVTALPASPDWGELQQALTRPHLVEAVLGGHSSREVPDGLDQPRTRVQWSYGWGPPLHAGVGSLALEAPCRQS